MSEAVSHVFIDEILIYINDLINTLDLSYKQQANIEEKEEYDTKFGLFLDSAYIPNSMND